MPIQQAIELARDRGLDLVEVAPNSVPPVCRVLDYGRFRYEQTKRDREARKGQKTGLLSEIRFRLRIAQHDQESKLRRARKLLEDRYKVKISVVFRGRELAHPERGVELLRRLAESLKEEARLEGPPSMEGRSYSVVLTPMVKREPAKEKVVEETKSTVEQEPEEAQA